MPNGPWCEPGGQDGHGTGSGRGRPFDLLRNVARSRGQKVTDLAEAVVDSTSNPLLPLPDELARTQPRPRKRGRSPRHRAEEHARTGENVAAER
jgi:hypothetical protein